MATKTLSTKKAFPTAWGEGADQIIGGRGGVLFFITSLANTDTATLHSTGGEKPYYTGTFRGAMNLKQPRIVIPRVSGRVNYTLLAPFSVDHSYLTYLGQLAPEGGLYITDDRFYHRGANQLIFRFYKHRIGKDKGTDLDAMEFQTGDNIIVDHSSFGWSSDEVFSSIGEKANNSSEINQIFQYNIFSQAIPGHNTGSIFGDSDLVNHTNVSMMITAHDNFWVGVTHRVPNINGGYGSKFRIYNNTSYGTNSRLGRCIGTPTMDVAYNNYIRSPEYGINSATKSVNEWDSNALTNYPVTEPFIFTEGNYYPQYTPNPTDDNKILWRSTYEREPDGTYSLLPNNFFRTERLPITNPEVDYTPVSAQESYNRDIIGREVGCNRSTNFNGEPVIGHDSVDDYYIDSVIYGTNSQIPYANWIHPTIPSSTPYADSNWNGIPDTFEIQHGITTGDQVIATWNFSDYNLKNDAGYTALEIYSAYVAGDLDRLPLDEGGVDPDPQPGNAIGTGVHKNVFWAI